MEQLVESPDQIDGTGLRKYTELIGKHDGETAFVFGAGTSLYKKNLNFVKDYVTVTTNSGILLFDWSEGEKDNRYWITNDSMVREWTYWQDVKDSQSNKIIRTSWLKYREQIPNDFYVFWPRKTEPSVIDENEQGLAYCSSTPSCVDLAIQMGCKKIFLVGVDHYFLGERRYFWEYRPRREWPRRINKPRPGFVEQRYVFGVNQGAFSALNDFAKSKVCEIFNVGKKSKVTAFEKIDFEDIGKYL